MMATKAQYAPDPGTPSERPRLNSTMLVGTTVDLAVVSLLCLLRENLPLRDLGNWRIALSPSTEILIRQLRSRLHAKEWSSDLRRPCDCWKCAQHDIDEEGPLMGGKEQGLELNAYHKSEADEGGVGNATSPAPVSEPNALPEAIERFFRGMEDGVIGLPEWHKRFRDAIAAALAAKPESFRGGDHTSSLSAGWHRQLNEAMDTKCPTSETTLEAAYQRLASTRAPSKLSAETWHEVAQRAATENDELKRQLATASRDAWTDAADFLESQRFAITRALQAERDRLFPVPNTET